MQGSMTSVNIPLTGKRKTKDMSIINQIKPVNSLSLIT